MRKKMVITASVVGLLMVAAGAYVVATAAKPEPSDSSSGKPVVLGSLDGRDQNDSQKTSRTPAPLAVKPSNPTGNQLNMNDQSANSSTNSTPDLTQFEQYKTNQTALFQDLVVGTGAEAVAGKTLSMDYRGWLTNGQVFDESYARGQAFEFVLGQGRVIAGWDQGVAGMKVGGKRRLVVPPAAGYGDRAVGSIPAGSVLVFDVELHEVK